MIGHVFFSLWTIAQLFGCRWVGELGATSIWHRFSLTEHCQLYCSWTYLYTNCSFFILLRGKYENSLVLLNCFQAPVNLSHFFPKMIRLVRKSFRSTTSILTGRILRSRELSSMGPVIHWQLQMYVSQALVSRHSLEDGKFSVGCLKIVKGCGVTIPMEEPPRIQRGEDSRTTVMIRNLVGISARKVGTHGW